MRLLVLVADPSENGLAHQLYRRSCAVLERTGHEVVAVDLCADGFVAAMSPDERRAYHSDHPVLDEAVARQGNLLGWADGLVFVYPSRWVGLPPVLKGWLERVLVPGVAFHLHPRTHRVRSDLRHVRRLVVVTVHDDGRRQVALRQDAGRRVLLRALRMLAARRCRSTYLALYQAPAADVGVQERFARRVEDRLARL